MEDNALNDVKILDFSQWVSGPLVTKTFAAYGAKVVVVESMKMPAVQRWNLPHKDNKKGLNRSGMFAYFMANKYSVSLDMSHPNALAIAKRLVAWADIVVENFTPGVMERWGLGYENLKEVKPGIVMLRLSAQGQTGPLRTYGSLGMQVTSLAGFPHFTGYPDREPLSLMFAYTDYFSPWPAVALLCAALCHRNRTGRGTMLDISQFELPLQFIAPYLLNCSVNKKQLMRRGNQHAYAVPHDVYPCKGDDCWCSICVFTDEEWDSFCNVLGNPPWTKESKFATFLSRKKNEVELNQLVGEWTAKRTREEILELMQSAGVASGIVKKGTDIYEDPQLKERNFFWMLNHKEIGDFTHMGEPSVLSKTPAQPRMPSPCLGEHTEYVCKEFLNMSEQEFDDLLVTGVFGL